MVGGPLLVTPEQRKSILPGAWMKEMDYQGHGLPGGASALAALCPPRGYAADRHKGSIELSGRLRLFRGSYP